MLEHALCHLKLEEILHSICRAPVVLGGVEIVYLEGRILNLVQERFCISYSL